MTAANDPAIALDQSYPSYFNLRRHTDNEPETPIELVSNAYFSEWLSTLDSLEVGQVRAAQFLGEENQIANLVDHAGRLSRVAVGTASHADIMRTVSNVISRLPSGIYRLSENLDSDAHFRAAVGWAHGCYEFDLSRRNNQRPSRHLAIGSRLDWCRLRALCAGAELARRLIDTPSNQLGPSEFAVCASKTASSHNAEIVLLQAEDLSQHYPLVHAVGRSSSRPPCVIDLRWGEKNHFKLTLVGKGVCFDSGGLNLKRTESIRYMKRDMAGAAIMLGLAHMIMSRSLPIRLRVLLPCADNSISATSLRPSDSIVSRSGKRIEISNTDAEGRLILADAIYEAGLESPDLLIDCGSLTGASRSVLGPDFGIVISPNIDLAQRFVKAGGEAEDPLWPLPLWTKYRGWLRSSVADTLNTTNGLGMAGPIIAALFLSEFVNRPNQWVHLDVPGWNFVNRNGRPEGAEPTAYYALEQFLNDELARARS